MDEMDNITISTTEDVCESSYEAKIQQLEKENADLKSKLVKAEKETLRHKSLAEGHHRLEKRLEFKLASIKYLNREDVEKILWDVVEWSDLSEEYIFIEDPNDNFITAICNLALPKIDKEKLRQILNDKLFEYGVSGFPHIANALATEIIKEINE